MRRGVIVLILFALVVVAGVWFLVSKQESERVLGSRIPPSEWVGRVNVWEVFQWVSQLDLPKSDSLTWKDRLPINPLVNPILFGNDGAVFMATERNEKRQRDTVYHPSKRFNNLTVLEHDQFILIGYSDSAQFSMTMKKFISDSAWNTQIPKASGLFSGNWNYRGKTIPIRIEANDSGLQLGDGLNQSVTPAFAITLSDSSWIEWVRTKIASEIKGHPFLEKTGWTAVKLMVNDTVHTQSTRIVYRYDDYFNKVEDRIVETKVQPEIGFGGRRGDSLWRAGRIRVEPNDAALELRYDRNRWKRVIQHIPMELDDGWIPAELRGIHIRLDSSGLNGIIMLDNTKKMGQSKLDSIQ